MEAIRHMSLGGSPPRSEPWARDGNVAMVLTAARLFGRRTTLDVDPSRRRLIRV
jgi:hypothetical protein